jgi:predicted XRE-type DNA-binding protein
LKVKAEILSAILEHVRAQRYTQAQLVDLLDEYQPSVSNLLKGRIAQVSIEKLLRYADRLHLETSIDVRPREARLRRSKSRPRSIPPPVTRRAAVAV